MITTVIAAKRRFLLYSIAAIALTLPGVASTQNKVEVSTTDSVTKEETTTGRTFTPEDFKRFAPRNALDMLSQVPGFTIREGNQGRGLGQVSMNVCCRVGGYGQESRGKAYFDDGVRRQAFDLLAEERNGP